MPYEIETKDGIVIRGIPDGIAPDDPSVKAKVANARFQRAASNPDYAKAGEMALQGASGLDKFRAGAGKAITDLARGVGQLTGMVPTSEITENKQRDAALMSTGAGMAGNIAGNVAAALPTMAIPGVNTVAGAGAVGGALGALAPVAEGESRGINVALGAAGGAGGQMLGTAAGRLIRPVRSQLGPEASRLAGAAQQRGIPLDAADMTGSRPLTVLRDVMANMPLTADRQMAQQAAKQTAFNRAVSGTYGAADDVITPQSLTAARDRIGQQFTDLSQRNTLQANQGLLNSLANIESEVSRNAPSDVARVVKNNIDDVLSKVQPGDVISGRAYRELDSKIGRLSRNSASGDVRNYLGQVRDALRTAMDQSIGEADRQAWKEARKQYANLMTVAPLAARNETGDVSGRALLNRVMQQNRTNTFSGGGDLGELGRIGRAFVAEQTPNSGTAQRLFYQRFLENPLTALWQQGVGGISYPIQGMLNSQAGQRYLSQGLLPITDPQQQAINGLLRSVGVGLPLVQFPQQ